MSRSALPGIASGTARRLRTRLGGSVFPVAFLGYFLLAAAWSSAMPYDGPADELQHTVRAYGVMTGHVIVPDGTRVPVPQSIAEPALTGDAPGRTPAEKKPCLRWHLDVTAACAVGPSDVPADRTTTTTTTTGAGTYNPFYYWVVGVPIKLWPDMRGIIAARLITGAAMSALFAAAVSVAVRIGRGRGKLMALGTIAAITPVSVNLSGAVNPAGLEIAAAVALWAALIAIVYERDDSWRVFTLLGVSGALTAVLRELGIGWLLGAVCVAALGLSRNRIRELTRLRAFWICAGAVAIAVAAGVLWIAVSSQGGIGPVENPSGKVPHGVQIWIKELTHRTPYYTSGLVGLLSYGDVSIPLPLTFAWFAAVGILLVVAVRRCGRRVRVQLAVLVAIPYAILVLADAAAVKQGYWLSQGRYALPMLAGAPMLAGYMLSRASIWEPARQARMLRIAAVVLVPLYAVGLWTCMIRFQHAFRSPHPNMAFLFGDASSINPFSGEWLPPLGPVLPVVCCLAGVAMLIRLLFRTASAYPAAVDPVPGPRRPGVPEPQTAGSGVLGKAESSQRQ